MAATELGAALASRFQRHVVAGFCPLATVLGAGSAVYCANQCAASPTCKGFTHLWGQCFLALPGESCCEIGYEFPNALSYVIATDCCECS